VITKLPLPSVLAPRLVPSILTLAPGKPLPVSALRMVPLIIPQDCAGDELVPAK